MLNMLKELCRLNGVSGDEDEVLYGILDRVRAIPQRQEGEITALD